jgi:shikimate dehydrogenase
MRVFGLIGFPLGHSFSKSYFTEKFKKEKIAARYETFPIESLTELPSIFEENPLLEGLNVTIPHKEKILPFLHQVEPEARKIGAVNTIRIVHLFGNIQLTGFNTDVDGFNLSLVPLLKAQHTKALIIGSGGASKAICYVLDKLHIQWQIVSRTPQTSQMISYSEVTRGLIKSCKLIINTTPLGMFPKTEEYPDLPYNGIGAEHLLYDLVYNPQSTQFMQKGLQNGAQVKNGLEMLQIQADKAWEIWNTR